MLSQACSPYRGFSIILQVMELEARSFNGAESRYTVAWSVQKRTPSGGMFESFPEPVEFLSVGEALDYAEGRAHTFIDGALASDGGK
jgi:hypothetical protein